MINRGKLINENITTNNHQINLKINEISSIDIQDNFIALGTLKGSIFFVKNLFHFNFNYNIKENIIKMIIPPNKERIFHSKVNILKFSPCLRYICVGLENGIVIIFQLNL